MKTKLQHALRYLLAAFKGLAMGAVLGALCGALGAGFHHLIDEATTLRGE